MSVEQEVDTTKELSIDNCNISDKGSDMISTVMCYTTSLEKLSISHIKMSARSCLKVTAALKSISFLQFLIMRDNGFSLVTTT